MIKKLTEKKVFAISLILTLIILSIIPLIRILSYDSLQQGELPYYNTRLAQYISDQGIPEQDPLAPGIYTLEPYHLLLSAASQAVGITAAAFLLPYLLGIISIILSYLILNQFNLNAFKKLLILSITIISPIFVYTFSSSNSFALTLPVLLLGFYFFTQEKRSFFIPAIIIFAITPFLGMIPAIMSILFAFIYTLNNKDIRKRFYLLSAITILISLVYWVPNLPNLIVLPFDTATSFIADLGAEIGVGIFTILLAIIGLYSVWKTKKQLISYTIFLVLIIASFYFTNIKIYLNPIFTILAGLGFFALISMKWQLKIIKTLTITIVIYGLIFSSISYINRTSQLPPDSSIIESLEWLEQNSDENDIIFSHYHNGFWIETIAQRPVLLDSNFNYIPDAKQRLDHSYLLFYSRTLKTTTNLLDNYNVSYIYITPSMKQGEVWTKEQQGLLFLFRNSETFKKVYSQEEIEIWKYLG